MDKLFKVSDVVKDLLMSYPSMRDNDNELVAAVWYKECDKLNPQTLYNFLEGYSKGEYTMADSITRCRRKLQEDNPHLRGKVWIERHNRAEKIREQIPNIKL